MKSAPSYIAPAPLSPRFFFFLLPSSSSSFFSSSSFASLPARPAPTSSPSPLFCPTPPGHLRHPPPRPPSAAAGGWRYDPPPPSASPPPPPPPPPNAWLHLILRASPTAHAPPLSHLSSNFPSLYTAGHLLGLSRDSAHVFVTLHTSRPGHPRPPYATSSQALRLPLATPAARLFARDALALALGTAAPTHAAPLTDRSTAFAARLLPPALRRLLRLDAAAVADAAARVLRARPARRPVPNRVHALLLLLRQLRVRLVAASVEEVESVGEEGVRVRGFLFVKRVVGNAEEGHEIWGEEERVPCEASVAVGLANGGGVVCYVEKAWWSRGVAVRDMVDVFAERGRMAVQVKTRKQGQEEEEEEEKKKKKKKKKREGKGETDAGRIGGLEVWELKAEDVLTLNEDDLRRVLMQCRVGTTSKESRDSLLWKVLLEMDEVERREAGIILAAKRGLYGVAAELQKGRSKRGMARARLREVEAEGKWEEAARLARQLSGDGRADVTAEEGSYDPNLDRDDWYRPAR